MTVPAQPLDAIWHDVECGGYSADLPIWTELALAAPGPTLELGAGTGRVALRLAAAGVVVVAVDRSAALVERLRVRAGIADVDLEAICADARRLDLGRRFAAILAPMQFVHLLGGVAGRAEALAMVRRHLTSGGIFAAAVLADGADALAPAPDLPPLPDVREVDGWIYSSLPTEVVAVPGGIEIRRLRQIVSPAGELSEELETILLDRLAPAQLEQEAEAAGLTANRRLEVAATDEHVGSTICVLEAG